METYSKFGTFLAFICCVAIVALIFSPSKVEEQVNDVLDKEQELGVIINDLDSGDVTTVSSATHPYLFRNLQERSARDANLNWKKDVVKVGSRLYYMRDISNGYALEPYDGSDQFEYHLIITQKSYQTNPAGYYLDVLTIKKSSGGYYNH